MIYTNKKIFIMMLLLFAASQVSAEWTGCKLLLGGCVDYKIGAIFSDVGEVNQNYNKTFKLLCDSYSSIGINN